MEPVYKVTRSNVISGRNISFILVDLRYIRDISMVPKDILDRLEMNLGFDANSLYEQSHIHLYCNRDGKSEPILVQLTFNNFGQMMVKNPNIDLDTKGFEDSWVSEITDGILSGYIEGPKKDDMISCSNISVKCKLEDGLWQFSQSISDTVNTGNTDIIWG